MAERWPIGERYHARAGGVRDLYKGAKDQRLRGEFDAYRIKTT